MITRREFFQGTAATSLLSLLPRTASAETPPAQKLNVLFLMVDDLRPELNCYGLPEIHSPNIDRLAKKGVRFDRAYCQFPVCNPSRSSMLTGLRPETLGIFTNQKYDVFRLKRPEVVTMPQLFRQNGYFTASFGKIIHNGVNDAGKVVNSQDPLSWVLCKDQGPSEEAMPGTKVDCSPKFPKGAYENWCWWKIVPNDQLFPDMLIASEAVEQLEAHRDKPFFIAAGFHKPHNAYVAPQKYFDLYPLDSVKLPDPPPAGSTADPALANPRGDLFNNFTEDDRRALKRAYHACTSFTDDQIGKVLDAMDRLELWDKTIVVLLIDHGYHLWEHNWLGKGTTYDLSARVPCIVWAPGLAGMGQSTEGIIESLDMYPTITELCGLKPPSVIEGKSFVPLLQNPAGPGKKAAYTVIRSLPDKNGVAKLDARSVRTDRWRYTHWSDGSTSLFDHSKDPLEYTNLASDSDHQSVCAELKDLLHQIN